MGSGSAFAALMHDRLQLLSDDTMSDDTQYTPLLQEARLWQDDNWTAQVIKNEDDDGRVIPPFSTGPKSRAVMQPWLDAASG